MMHSALLVEHRRCCLLRRLFARSKGRDNWSQHAEFGSDEDVINKDVVYNDAADEDVANEKKAVLLRPKLEPKPEPKSEPKPEQLIDHFESLCDDCKKINFKDRIGAWEVFTPPARHICKLAHVHGDNGKSACQMCDLISSVRIKCPRYKSHTMFSLYSIRTPPTWRQTNVRVDEASVSIYVVECSNCPSEDFTQGHEHSRGYHLVGVTDRAPEDNIPRQIVPTGIDFKMISGWIARCALKHRANCYQADHAMPMPENFKLIDCHTRKIVKALNKHRYAALSYVWGPGKVKSHSRWGRGSLPGTLPQTIEDALEVAKRLGLQHIWIDRYCIDQENAAERHSQIRQMDIIFRRAFVTIIAAAGKDPHFGLPGVSSTPRVPRAPIHMKGTRLVSAERDPKTSIEESLWMNRGWTYQESFFSCRRLIFTENQITFECRLERTNETFPKRWNFHPNERIFTNPRNENPKPWEISTALSHYAGRQLSYESDAIRAFEGVFHAFQTGEFPVWHYFGVPVMPPCMESPGGQAMFQERAKGDSFVIGLCWRNVSTGKRRYQFPSWTWAGWSCRLQDEQFELKWGIALYKENRPRVLVEREDGISIPFEEVSLENDWTESTRKFIHLETLAVPLKIRRPANLKGMLRDSHPAYQAVFDDDDELVMYVSVHLLSEYIEWHINDEESLESNEADGEVLGLVLTRHHYSFQGSYMMIVHQHGQYFERIGYLELNAMHTTIYTKSTSRAVPLGQLPVDKLPDNFCVKNAQRRSIRIG